MTPRYLNAIGQRHTAFGHEVKCAQRGELKPRLTPGDAWARLPEQMRQSVCLEALGTRGLQVMAKLWSDIDAHDRVRIGYVVRRIAGALV